MKPSPVPPAALTEDPSRGLALSGFWTAFGLGPIEARLAALGKLAGPELVADCSQIVALDTAGAWVLQGLVLRLQGEGIAVQLRGLKPAFERLLEAVATERAAQSAAPAPAPAPTRPALERIGRQAVATADEALGLLTFVGENAVALAGCVAHPSRWRGRSILYNLRSAGVDAVPIVALMSFMLGVVVAYQGADQLRRYGANIFVADLVGLSMLREFAPLITAIIIAGRSGSAYAAQIGTMAVNEEIDAMRTLGIAPLELLVLPKLFALMLAMPLLTVLSDVSGVFGGMLMARSQLDVGYGEFIDRFVKAVSPTAYLVGIGKAPVFAAIIAVVGCFQGFRAKGGADSVGRQTTRSVVQATFLVISADGLFSVAFSALDI
ncbi:MAG: MlaE family lipid ABC transporter permease subunit [Vitreoscilla sp.]|nr:MlaE family lipid ABC transporter permease subunit [Vitreoscilla sp.]